MNDAERQQEIARSLFLESGDALFFFDTATHRVIEANPAALRLTGYDRRELATLHLHELFEGDGEASIGDLVEAYRRTGFFRAREGYRLLTRAGPPVPVSVNVSRIHVEPEPLGLVAARDVRDAVRAREVVERFFRLSPALFAIIEPADDGGSRFVKLNPAWEATLGYPLDELLATPPRALIHPDDRPAADAGMLDLGRDGFAALELRLLRRDGRERWIAWQAFILDGMLYAVGRDTTDERNAAALAVAKEAAEAASRAKGEFLALVSHELRTPLASMLGFADLLLHDPHVQAAPPATLDALRSLRRSGEELGALIDDLLGLSQFESGLLRVRPTPCRLRDFVADLTTGPARLAAEKGLRLAVELRGNPPEVVSIDALRLRQVLGNLLGNAVKFTDSGVVRLELEPALDDAGAPALLWTVADTGPGIAPEDHARLFEPFYRAPAARAAGIPGTGLGLAICRRLAHLLGGRLDCSSEPGRGTRFTLTVPAPPLAIEPPAATAAPATAPGRLAARVLLAEDDPANRRAVALQLERAGADVVTAGDGAAALAAAREARDLGRPFDVILMDMHMPVLDGPEAIRRLRDAGLRTPIIALTADVLIGQDPVGRPADFDDVLCKPFRSADLIDRITALLSRPTTTGDPHPPTPDPRPRP
jgi:PAS domain S-box-containing protein